VSGPEVMLLGVRYANNTYMARDAANTARASKTAGDHAALWAVVAKMLGVTDLTGPYAEYELVRAPDADWETTGGVVWEAYKAMRKDVLDRLRRAREEAR
jgi:hypothetical protein